MEKFDSIIKQLSSVFAHFSNYLRIEVKEEFCLIDYLGQSYIIEDFDANDTSFTIQIDGHISVVTDYERSKSFRVYNHKKRTAFIPIDGKSGLLDNKNSKCDCIFFDESDFCFLEFKLNATSTTRRAVHLNRQKAVEQLSLTVDLFDEKFKKNYEGLNLEAYVCTPESYPRNNAAWKSFEVAFLEQHGIPLFEKNEKICR